MSEQQKQTLEYFKNNADSWQAKAVSTGYNVIEDRHRAVQRALSLYRNGSKLLDVGCGTGQLCIEAAKNGWKTVGIDFSETMIEQCNKNVTIDVSDRCEFFCESIFDFNFDKQKFDVVSAQGFIEYISLEQLHSFLRICKNITNADGRIAIGSRNRLFNLHSLNTYTEMEIQLDSIKQLLQQATFLSSSSNVTEAIKKLRNLSVDLNHPVSHPKTGIDVKTRYQYSPTELIGIIEQYGFIVDNIIPVNFHPFPISSNNKPQLDEIHQSMADLISQNLGNEFTLVPYSSSYVTTAKRL